MNVQIISVSHSLRPFEREWIDHYVRSAKRFSDLTLTKVKERVKDTPAQTTGATWTEIERKLPDRAFRIVLDPRGKLCSTDQFLTLFEKAMGRKIVFIIGGSYGLPDQARKTADSVVSLTPLTLPHRLTLLVLVEQVYRALSRKAGHPYHHE